MISTVIEEEKKPKGPSGRKEDEEDDAPAFEWEEAENGSSGKPRLMDLKELSLAPDAKVMLVLGSEGAGVSRVVSALATHHVTIPPQLNMDEVGKYPFNMVDSLNVGVSAALLIFQLKQQLRSN